MAFDDVEYVTEFPLNFTLQNSLQPNIDNVGLRGFRVVDSLLILDKAGSEELWTIYKLPEFENLGGYLHMGDGPLEFMQTPSLTYKNSFRLENDNLVTYLYDFQKGRILKFNISGSIATGELNLSEYEASLPPYSFAFALLKDNSFFLKEIANKDTQQERYILKKGQKVIPKEMKKLNDASIKEGEDFNILSILTLYDEQREIFVEMPIGLNNINIYKIDGSFSKSICIGESLSDIKQIQNENRWDRKYTFSDLRLFDDFFGVVHINEGMKDYQTERRNISAILLFGWDGMPLAKINTSGQFTSFDIDFINQELYTFDALTDEFVRYNISEILSEF
jgi:hypothetical protein